VAGSAARLGDVVATTQAVAANNASPARAVEVSVCIDHPDFVVDVGTG
jgi:hypothetical protein